MTSVALQKREEKAVANLMMNLKKNKKKISNWIDIARDCRFLLNHRNWGLTKMSEYFEVSGYQIRQIDKINDLNEDVRELVRNGDFGVDECYQLWRLGKERQSQVAKASFDLSSKELRQLVYFLLKNPNMSIEEAKRLTLETRTKTTSVLVIPLAKEKFEQLKDLAKKQGLKSPLQLVLSIVEDYLNEH